MRILVVDDDYISRVKLSQLLLAYGHCDNAPNGDIAIRLFEAAQMELAPYNLVTMDIVMPDMNGQEVLMRLRGIEKEWETPAKMIAKVIMITAKETAKDVASSYYEGCDGYLTKPVNPEKIRTALVEVGCDVG
jgi:two-component system, chemotaxis family, chemotaxis protein CheY